MNIEYWVMSSIDAGTVCSDICVPGKMPIILSIIGVGIWYILVHCMITGELIPKSWKGDQ